MNIGGLVSSLLAGLDINLLDVKMIALGYVRPQLVDSLCQRATNTLIVEGEKRWVNSRNVCAAPAGGLTLPEGNQHTHYSRGREEVGQLT